MSTYGNNSLSVAVGDFNNDGKQDIAITAGSVLIRLGDGLGGFSGTTNVQPGAAAWAVAIGDLVLISLADNPALKQAEFAAAFVLTEYFGYLRRDAEAGGFDFWLGILNDRGRGNYRGMVCSFITSLEYQRRFSPIITHTQSECLGR